MTERTFNIIMACKHRPETVANVMDSVRDYMSKECDCPIDYYDESRMAVIMKIAMYDYIDTCDKPSGFLSTMEGIIGKEHLSLGEHIARAFTIVRVRDNGSNHYINGFGEWMK